VRERIGSYPRVRVEDDGRSVVSQAGSVLLVETAEGGQNRPVGPVGWPVGISPNARNLSRAGLGFGVGWFCLVVVIWWLGGCGAGG
jgi:hypothetical protein